jgi:glycosyltransferase involved in cell wall biosynthesis
LHIVLVTETLVTGGAETFVLRLAAALQAHGISASLFVLRDDLNDRALAKSIAPNVPIAVVRVPLLGLVLRLDGLLFSLGAKFSCLRWLQVRQLRKYLARTGADIAHSHLLTTDLVTARACVSLSTPWVTTMHGDYLAYEKQGRNRAARIQDFSGALDEIETSVSHIVCITDRQMEQLGRLLPCLASKGRTSKIYNGYTPSGGGVAPDAPLAIAHIPARGFVIGMVARGILDKGWDVLISAFLELNLPNSWLVLVGDGDYLREIRPSLNDKRIIFAGNVVDPLRYIQRFDVGCLPSRYKSESLPTVVIEYLLLGKPVIASRIGEISAMLESESDLPSGLLIDRASIVEMTRQMKDALRRVHEDEKLRNFLQENTVRASLKFDMDKCLKAYLDIYNAAQPNHKTRPALMRQ